MEFDFLIEQDETGTVISDVRVTPGCRSVGRRTREARHNIHEAIELFLAVRGAPAGPVVAIKKARVDVQEIRRHDGSQFTI